MEAVLSTSEIEKDHQSPSGVTLMIDEDFARIRAHRSNIGRYQRLLRTTLSELEREFLERRLAEELTALEALAADTFPISLTMPAAPSDPAMLGGEP
jgi:hypothetical protein